MPLAFGVARGETTLKVQMTEEEFEAVASQSTLTDRSIEIGHYLLVEGHTGGEARDHFGIAHQRAYAIRTKLIAIAQDDTESYYSRRIQQAIDDAPQQMQRDIRNALRPLGLFRRR